MSGARSGRRSPFLAVERRLLSQPCRGFGDEQGDTDRGQLASLVERGWNESRLLGRRPEQELLGGSAVGLLGCHARPAPHIGVVRSGRCPRPMASQEGSTHEFGGVSPYRCATGACKVAVRASPLAFCAAVGRTPPLPGNTGQVRPSGWSLVGFQAWACPQLIDQRCCWSWVTMLSIRGVSQPRPNSRSGPDPTGRPLRAALTCTRLVPCQVRQQNLGNPLRVRVSWPSVDLPRPPC